MKRIYYLYLYFLGSVNIASHFEYVNHRRIINVLNEMMSKKPPNMIVVFLLPLPSQPSFIWAPGNSRPVLRSHYIPPGRDVYSTLAPQTILWHTQYYKIYCWHHWKLILMIRVRLLLLSQRQAPRAILGKIPSYAFKEKAEEIFNWIHYAFNPWIPLCQCPKYPCNEIQDSYQ